MQSVERIFQLLDMFGGRDSEWTVDELYERLGYTRSTLYRYLKTLTDAGLLTSLPGRGYALGPRIIELDYYIRKSDPVISAGRPVMEELVSQINGIALLCRRYQYKVLCIHQAASTDIVRSNYERGLARPLLRGAASVVILAYLPAHQLKKFYLQHAGAFAAAGLGESLDEVRAGLKAHRQLGWVTSTGHLTPGITGVAAPLFDGRQKVLGSLSLSIPAAQISEDEIPAIARQLLFSARIITRALSF